jgi:hypothetical protein
MPISWKGRLSQYAGRLHRIFEGKKEIKIFDYVDLFVPMLERMYHKRLRGYSELGYYVSGSENEDADLIYDTKNYVKKYDSDIGAAVKSITICSPRIKERQFWRIYYLVPDDASLILICSSEETISFELPAKVSLIRTDRAYCRFTVIDDRIVWYGSLSSLCENFSEASAIRIINPSLAGRLMEERLL